VKSILKIGNAIGGKIADFTEFDRKNYFYPDIPKGYQISQYKYPLISGGELASVKITRVHLEEDTARSTHYGDYSLIDFNRAGVPLMELVTDPVIENSKQALLFAKELQLLLRYLDVSDANMEKGEMRVEANISVIKKPKSKTQKLGVKVEVKNLNSFRAVERAIEFEIKRQIKVLECGKEIFQETRGWDENKQETFSQRIKEGSADYRYFPDPDLPKLNIGEIEDFKNIKLTELPWEKRDRYKKDFDIKSEDIESYITDRKLEEFFEEVVSNFEGDINSIKLASNYITSDLVGLMKNEGVIKFPAVKDFAKLIMMVKSGEISSRAAKDILKIIFKDGGNPENIAKEKKLIQKSDENELLKIVKKIIKENKQVSEDYRAGKKSSIQYLIGQGMKETKGSANPKILSKLFIDALKK
jgi:aspartyl-tRNA(Asn)/glutamyl-tRNA(Gln) amidotransferase subunit B